jgi:hypothetical protein
MISCKENGRCYMAWHCASNGCADKSGAFRKTSALEEQVEQLLLGTKEDFLAHERTDPAVGIVKVKSQAAQDAIEVADAQVNNVGLPTYSELLAVMRALNDNSWLDADTGTDDLEDAKAKARALLLQADAI